MQQHSSRELNGVQTELVIQHYADRVLVLVTQLGKVAHIIQASIPPAIPLLPPTSSEDGLPLIEPSPSIELTSLFGSAPSAHLATLHSLYASHIAMLIWTTSAPSDETGDRPNVIVSLALKKSQDAERDGAGLTDGELMTFKGVMRMIVDLLQGKTE